MTKIPKQEFAPEVMTFDIGDTPWCLKCEK